MSTTITLGVLALQGAFLEHLRLLDQAASQVTLNAYSWKFCEVRKPQDLEACHALIIPGGESTAISLVAARSGLLEPLRDFVKVKRKPVWGTCAGLILLAESANRTKKGGQDLIGGLDVRVNRNHFGRQTESFEVAVDLPFLREDDGDTKNNGAVKPEPFHGVFIRAPVLERVLPSVHGERTAEAALDTTVVAPSKDPLDSDFVLPPVQILATLPGRSTSMPGKALPLGLNHEAGDIIVVKQGNVVGTSFHPELTDDIRMHVWWLRQVRTAIERKTTNDR